MASGARDNELWHEMLERQSGVISREQALLAGWTADQVRQRQRNAQWHRLHPGVYATFTGPLPWQGRLWAALLHGGHGCAASHLSAGRLQGLVDDDPPTIEIVVPWGRTVLRQPGVVVRSSRHLEHRRHPARTPPQTRPEDTVLDLVEGSGRLDDVVGWLARACQRRLTTPERLRSAVSQRSRLTNRRLVLDTIGDVSDGVASPLEHRYRRDVERAHGLPQATRGERVTVGGRHWYADVRYPSFCVRVELEGLRWHRPEDRWRDGLRDNAAVLVGDVVLRYDWRAVAGRPCATANEVAQVLRRRGWRGTPRRCPRCTA
jgi:hypothetical protein